MVLRGGSARAPYNFVAPWSHPAASNGPTLNLPFARPRPPIKEKVKEGRASQLSWSYVTGTTISFADFVIGRFHFVHFEGTYYSFLFALAVVRLKLNDLIRRNEIDLIIDRGRAQCGGD